MVPMSTEVILLNYVHKILSQTALFLKEVITLTYNNQIDTIRTKFYLVEYRPRERGFHQRRIYGDPSIAKEGGDIKWQLKHLRWQMKMYAELMAIYDEELDNITKFLLYNIVNKCFLGSKDLSCLMTCNNFILDVVEACQNLICCVDGADFYSSIQNEVSNSRLQIELLEDQFQRDISSMKITTEQLDSKKVLNFIHANGKNLTKEIENEASVTDTSHKPLTSIFLSLIIPEIEKRVKEDSGIFLSDSCFIKTPLKSNNAFSTIALTPPGLDTSIVVVDTPLLRNKAVDAIKGSELLTSSPNQNQRIRSSIDQMDGSFVLL